jgi:hypothetical protein
MAQVRQLTPPQGAISQQALETGLLVFWQAQVAAEEFKWLCVVHGCAQRIVVACVHHGAGPWIGGVQEIDQCRKQMRESC